jgi:hypothetical protein
MFGKQVFVSGVAAATVFVGFALATANAEFKEPVMPASQQVAMIAMAPLNSPETSQDQVWDMTYGTERASGTTVETAASANDEPLVDYTFG